MLFMNCSWALPNLAVARVQNSTEEFQELRALKVTAVLSLQTDEDRGEGGIEAERTAAEKAGLIFSNVPIRDYNRVDLRTCLPAGVAGLERLLQQGQTRIRALHGRSESFAYGGRSLLSVVPGSGTLASAQSPARVSRLHAGRGGYTRRSPARSPALSRTRVSA